MPRRYGSTSRTGPERRYPKLVVDKPADELK
jgi:hypothetical protein